MVVDVLDGKVENAIQFQHLAFAVKQVVKLLGKEFHLLTTVKVIYRI